MKKKILLADDDPGIREVFSLILDKAGYSLELKADASEILKGEFTVPDLFLIDRLLSGIDGTDICRHLKSNPLTSHVPVIMISASPDIAAWSVKAGADDFIEKPFEMTHLLNMIEHYTNRDKTKGQFGKID